MKKILLSLSAVAFLVAGVAIVQPTPANATWWTKDKAQKTWSWHDHWAKQRAWWAGLWIGKRK